MGDESDYQDESNYHCSIGKAACYAHDSSCRCKQKCRDKPGTVITRVDESSSIIS